MMKTSRDYAELLIGHWIKATPSQLSRGKSWYGRANRICNQIAKETDTPLRKVVGILSALSPSNKWERNIEDTRNFILSDGQCRVCTYRVQKAKALRILRGNYSEAVVADVLAGPKTRAFFANILHPRTDHNVTIDRWALRAVGEGVATPKGLLPTIREGYKIAATVAGLRVHELQAVAWLVEKELPSEKGSIRNWT